MLLKQVHRLNHRIVIVFLSIIYSSPQHIFESRRHIFYYSHHVYCSIHTSNLVYWFYNSVYMAVYISFTIYTFPLHCHTTYNRMAILNGYFFLYLFSLFSRVFFFSLLFQKFYGIDNYALDMFQLAFINYETTPHGDFFII